MMSETPTPHNHFFRASITNPRVALEFLQSHLPEKFSKIADLASLRLVPGTFVDEELQESLTDALYSVNFQNKPGYFYFIIEHQSQAQPLMPLRLLEYFIKIFRMHIKEYKTNQLPLIYPFVLYNGEKSYSHTTDFFDLFEDPELARKTIFEPFNLIDLTEIDDSDFKKLPLVGMMEFFLKHARARNLLAKSIRELITFFIQTAESRNEIELVTTGYYYFLNTQEKRDVVFKIFSNSLSEKNKSKVMTIAQALRQEGKQEGRQEGIRSLFERQVKHRFPHEAQNYLHLVKEVDIDTIYFWAEKLMDAKSIEEVFVF